MLSQDDYDELQRIIRASLYSPEDFEISTMDNYEKSKKYHVDVTEVSVKNLRTNITINYRSGFDSYWLLTLEKDIEEGRYK